MYRNVDNERLQKQHQLEDNAESWKHITGLANAMCIRDFIFLGLVSWLVYLTWFK